MTTVVAVGRGEGGRKGQTHTLFGRPQPLSQVARRLVAVALRLSEAISSCSGSESSFLISSSRGKLEEIDSAPSFSAMATESLVVVPTVYRGLNFEQLNMLTEWFSLHPAHEPYASCFPAFVQWPARR